MTNLSELLSIRQAIARAEFAKESQKPQNQASEVYTFAGYASGLDCKVKKANGEILNARLETNGMLKEGQVICCYQSGGQLFVRGMNKPYPEDPSVPESKSKSRIKILFVKKTTTNVELYIGGDRQKPKLISKFPLGTVIKGLCHNLGEGDKYSIGVTTELKIDATVTDRYVKTWKASGGKSETTTIKAEWKNDRIQPLGHGFFAEGWMPKLLEKKWLFTTLNAAKTEKTLNFFDNKEVYKLRTVPAAANLEAYVIRKALDDYNIVITAIATGGTKQISILTKVAVEALPKVKPEKWVFEAIDHLIDKNGTVFLDKNLTGSAQIDPKAISKKLALKIWQAAIGIFKLSSTAKLNEYSIIQPSPGNTESKKATGFIARDLSNLLEIKLSKTADAGPGFPDGSPLPPPGPNPLKPYENWVHSWGVPWANEWSRFPIANGRVQNDPSRPNDPPMWVRSGICIGLRYEQSWNIDGLADTDLLSDFLGLTYRPRSITAVQQYQMLKRFVPTGTVNIIYPWDGIQPLDNPAGSEWIVSPRLLEHFECAIVVTQEGQIIEIWDAFFNNPNKDRYVVNFPPNQSQVPTPPAKTNPDPDPTKIAEPTYKPWTLEDYLWNDPIVIGRNGESLWKNKVFIDYTGNPPKKPAAKKDEKLLKFKAAKIAATISGGLSEEIAEKTVAGKFPLLCSEDNLISSKLFRVDRSVFYPAIPGTPDPRRSSIKKLFVETYALSNLTTVTVKKYPIFPIPDGVEILSASFHL